MTDLSFRNRKTWKNVIGNQVATPLRTFEPTSLEGLRQVVVEAETKRLRVRAVGSGHSYSDVALPSDYLINPRRLDQVRRVASDEIRAGLDGSVFVEVGAGVTLKSLNRRLDQLGLSLANMGAIDEQTISGAVSTGTHGSGFASPGLPEFVRSMVLVGGDGRARRMESSDGITPPDSPLAKDLELVQDDDCFFAAVLGLGAMGIVHSYVLEVRPTFWLKEVKVLEPWEVVREHLLNGKYLDAETSYSLQINPYKVDGVRDCLVRTQVEVERPKRRTFNEKMRNFLATVLPGLPGAAWFSRQYLAWFPRRTPTAMRSSLRSQTDRKGYINKSYKVLLQGAKRLKQQGYDTEFAFPVDERKYVEALERVFEVADQMQAEGEIYQSSPIGIRFVAASQAYLSPEFETPVVHVDLPTLYGSKGARQLLDRYQDVCLQFGGKPHWGKMNNRLNGQRERLAEWYPKLDTWREVKRQLDPHGTFDNVFTDRLGLSVGSDHRGD